MRKVALVFTGGFCGTLARYLLSPLLLSVTRSLAPATPTGFALDILLINLTGALAIGLLYGLFERSTALASDIRLLLGTGFLGAYTTFSSLAVGGYTLLSSGAVLLGELYLLGSVVLGVLCAYAGVALAGRLVDQRRRTPRALPARLGRRRPSLRDNPPSEGEKQRL